MSTYRERIGLSVVAWTAMLLVSELPNIVLGIDQPSWLVPAKTGVMVLFSIGCYLVRPLRPLAPYMFVLLALRASYQLSRVILQSSLWQETFFRDDTSYYLYYGGAFLADILLAAAVAATLWLLYRKRERFFLVKGDLSAPIKPVRWLGIGEGNSWRTFGWIFAGAMGVGILIPTFLGGSVAEGQLQRALPMAAAGIGFAAINALTEEVYYRTAALATLAHVIGGTQAILISAVMFGLAHWQSGAPPGLLGSLLTAFLAYILGKAMLETRGFAWAWFIHFVPDVVVFAGYALSWSA